MRRLLLLLLLCGVTLPAMARDPAHPRIGLVLSGGGARGAAHVGVLKVLEELRIPISVVVGTSMGALVGGAYASGPSPAEMERSLTTVDWDQLFVDDSPREDWPIRRREQSLNPKLDFSIGIKDGKISLPSGALAGQKIEIFFSQLVKNADGIRKFDDLPIPYRAVATDLEDGSMKVFDAGPLPEVMRASMSVPGVFAPVLFEDHLYVDGGLVRNLPLDVARAMGVDPIIAVNLGGGYLPRDQLESVVGVLGPMVAILTEQNVTRSLKQLRPGKDLLITPELGDMSSSDFSGAARAIRIGEAAARKAAPRLAHLSVSPQEYAAWLTSRPRAIPDRAAITRVEVRGLTYVNPKIFEPLVKHQQGRPLNRPVLDKDIERLYGRGIFQNINYNLDPQDGSNSLVVNAREKPWGPGYLTFADLNYNRVAGHWGGAFAFGANSIVASAEVGKAFGGQMPYYDQFALGGFLHLSGYANDQFRGNQLAFGSLIYYRLLTDLPPPLGRGVYFGTSLEIGELEGTNPFVTRSGTRFGSSVFLAADTWLGPAYIGLGLGGDGNTTGYFILGDLERSLVLVRAGNSGYRW